MTSFSPSAQAIIGLVAAEMGARSFPRPSPCREKASPTAISEEEPIAVERRLYWHRGTQSRAVQLFLGMLRPGMEIVLTRPNLHG